jgi:hypothetical protein
MKHCPQCEFTFDDQVQFCDFDGTELNVVPELPPSLKSVPFAPASSGSSVRRLITSPAGLAALAFAGVALSALLIGYYDSESQPKTNMSVPQTRSDTASTVPSTQVDTVGQVETQANRPRIISTQRRIGVDELPSSMVKRLLEGSSSRSAKSRRGPSTTKLVATTRGPSSPKLLATTRKAANTTRQSQGRNQARPGPRDRGRQQHSVARVAKGRQGGGANESAHHRKDSKVITILKKTGSILKRPFELIADR